MSLVHTLGRSPVATSLLACAAALASLIAPASSLAGDLNPPPGPVSRTMKPLDAIDPRAVVNDLPGSDIAVHLIDQPGQYVLTRNIVGEPGKHGIFVSADGDVTIHLNGFSIVGVPGSLDGISSSKPAACAACSLSVFGFDPVEIRSTAKITGFDGACISATNIDSLTCARLTLGPAPGRAVSTNGVKRVIHRDLAVRNCLVAGIESRLEPIPGTDDASFEFEGVTVDACGGSGLYIQCPDSAADISISNSRFSRCAADGITILSVPRSPDGSLRPPMAFSIENTLCSGNAFGGLFVQAPAQTAVCGKTDHFRAIGNAGNGAEFRKGPGQPVYGEIKFERSSFQSNGAGGLRSNNPLYVENSNAGDNPLFGISVDVNDPYLLAGEFRNVTVARCGVGFQCSRGRYAHADCQISDCGSSGISMGQGCLIMSRTSVTRCEGDGISSLNATLHLNDCDVRRNTGKGIRCAGGTFNAENLFCEFNEGGGAQFVDTTTITLKRCVFSDNDSDGVTVSSAVGPVRWMAPESLSHRNNGRGFHLENCAGPQFTRCQTSGNTGVGFSLSSSVTGAHIEACSSTGDAGGFSVQGTGNVVIACSAQIGPLGAFSIVAGNTAGPFVDSGNIGASCNPRANVVH